MQQLTKGFEYDAVVVVWEARQCPQVLQACSTCIGEDNSYCTAVR